MNGSENHPLICWDSCIFLAWFKQERDKPLDVIRATLISVANNKTTLLVSALSCAEVLDKAGESTAGTEFVHFVKRPNVIVANVDMRVGMIAREIREIAIAALGRGELTKSVSIPDSLIAATAVLYRANELQTFDPVLLEIGTKGWHIFRGLRVCSPADAPPGPLFAST